ncbi:MAG: hypothetical protein JST64_01340 [Actinobacteria bacterium]|nr:hypothetical protein [Actinomycetota bacterium]
MTPLRVPRRSTLIVLAVTMAVAIVAAACTPPTVPDPGVIAPPAGGGRDPSVDVAPSSGCSPYSAGLPAGRSTVSIVVGATTRTSLVDVPSTPSTSPRRLLVSLHPFLMDPQTWDWYSGLAEAGNARGYIVVTPLGSQPGPRWAVPGGLASDTDDLTFIGALVDHVEQHSCIDRNRVFAAGFSAGAAMAQALSCTMPGRFAGVAGSGGVNLTSLCPDSPGTDTLVLHGSADPIVPPAGSQIPFTPPVGLAVATVVAQDAARAGCDPIPVIDQPAPSVHRELFRHCGDGRRVEYLSLIGAGHTWAGSPNALLEIVTGPTNTAISATTTVLDFFDRR